MKELILEAHLQGAWHKAAILSFSEPEKGRYGKVSLEYFAGYVVQFQNTPAALPSNKIQEVPNLALKYQVPKVVLEHQTANLNLMTIPDKLKGWGLL